MKAKIIFKGGSGSGNFGHSGRKGKVGGSNSGGSNSAGNGSYTRQQFLADSIAERIGDRLGENVRASDIDSIGKSTIAVFYGGNDKFNNDRNLKIVQSIVAEIAYARMDAPKGNWVDVILDFGKLTGA